MTWDTLEDLFDYQVDSDEELQDIMSILKRCKDIAPIDNCIHSIYLENVEDDYNKYLSSQAKKGAKGTKVRNAPKWINEGNVEKLQRHFGLDKDGLKAVIDKDITNIKLLEIAKEDIDILINAINN